MTPEENRRRQENRRRLAQARASATEAPWKSGAPQMKADALLTTEDMIYAAKLHRPGGGKSSGRKGRSHSFSASSRPGVRNPNPAKAQRLG